VSQLVLINSVSPSSVGWCNSRQGSHGSTFFCKLITELYLLCCCCLHILLLLLLLGTLSCIVTHLSTSKASHCAHVSLLPTAAVALSSLWWGPKLGTLPASMDGLLLALCPKSKVLNTRNRLLLLSRSLNCKPNLLDEVIPHPLPCRHNLPGNNAMLIFLSVFSLLQFIPIPVSITPYHSKCLMPIPNINEICRH
jgi:hypothetical protein